MRSWRIAAVLALAAAFAAAARAEGGPAVRARVVFETGPTQVRVGPASMGSGWIDLIVDGAGEAAARRCARLVDLELHRVYPPGAHLHPRLARACGPAPLPPAEPPPPDASVLRAEEALGTTSNVFAAEEGRTSARRVRYTRSGSAIECERDWRKAEGDTSPELRTPAHVRCGAGLGRPRSLAPSGKRNVGRSRWLERDLADERCEEGRALSDLSARHHDDGVVRACVRE